jgi:hypothetical protein
VADVEQQKVQALAHCGLPRAGSLQMNHIASNATSRLKRVNPAPLIES